MVLVLVADHLVLHAVGPVIQKLGSHFSGGLCRFPDKHSFLATKHHIKRWPNLPLNWPSAHVLHYTKIVLQQYEKWHLIKCLYSLVFIKILNYLCDWVTRDLPWKCMRQFVLTFQKPDTKHRKSRHKACQQGWSFRIISSNLAGKWGQDPRYYHVAEPTCLNYPPGNDHISPTEALLSRWFSFSQGEIC